MSADGWKYCWLSVNLVCGPWVDFVTAVDPNKRDGERTMILWVCSCLMNGIAGCVVNDVIHGPLRADGHCCC